MREMPWYLWLAISSATTVVGYEIGITERDKDHKCEFTVPYMVYPALTITCDGPGRTQCDTLYTYSDWGKR